jgi:hypothetical protein
VGRPVAGGTTGHAQPPARRVGVEFILAALVIGGLALALWRLAWRGYLPQPFYYRTAESLMDLYTPAFWANHADAYDRWGSLYPPLSFVYL